MPCTERDDQESVMRPGSVLHPETYAEFLFGKPCQTLEGRYDELEELIDLTTRQRIHLLPHQPPMHSLVFQRLDEHPAERDRHDAFRARITGYE